MSKDRMSESGVRAAIEKMVLHASALGCTITQKNTGDAMRGFETTWTCPEHGFISGYTLSWDEAAGDVLAQSRLTA